MSDLNGVSLVTMENSFFPHHIVFFNANWDMIGVLKFQALELAVTMGEKLCVDGHVGNFYTHDEWIGSFMDGTLHKDKKLMPPGSPPPSAQGDAS